MLTDPVTEFARAMLAAGLTPPDMIEPDGLMHRFDADGRKGKKTGWYTLHLDGLAAGNFGCWRTLPEGVNWCSKTRDAMTEAERLAYAQKVQAIRAQREADRLEAQATAARECAHLWSVSRPCPDGGHPYLVKKGIRPYGLQLMGKGESARLLIPLYLNRQLVNLQFIDGYGNKRFKTGGRVQGAYCAIGKPRARTDTVIIAEGFATGATLFEATGHAVAVAFNSGNLLAVAQGIRTNLPEARIVLAADDDHLTAGNPGLTMAREAAQAVGGFVAIPTFGEHRPPKATDFNDLAQLTTTN